MLMVDPAGLIVLANSQIERMFLYGREELIGQAVEVMLPHRHVEAHVKHRDEYQRDPSIRPMGAGREVFGLRKDGSEVSIEVGLSQLQTPDGDFVLCSVTDVTERRQAEREKEYLTRHLQRLAGKLIRRRR
jgi:PAS domain S-box-containing protein